MAGPFGPRLQHYEIEDTGYATPCWTWIRCRQKNGYGKGSLYGKWGLAHRLYYEWHVGPIPEGKVLDHLCRNRACVNPDHLEPVTLRENLLRGESFIAVQARKTHCPQGHPLSGSNLAVWSDGQRRCRACCRTRNRAWQKLHTTRASRQRVRTP